MLSVAAGLVALGDLAWPVERATSAAGATQRREAALGSGIPVFGEAPAFAGGALGCHLPYSEEAVGKAAYDRFAN